MNVAGVMLLGFIGSLAYSAEAQAAYAVAYSELFSLVTWTAVGLMCAAATVAGPAVQPHDDEGSEKGRFGSEAAGRCCRRVVSDAGLR